MEGGTLPDPKSESEADIQLANRMSANRKKRTSAAAVAGISIRPLRIAEHVGKQRRGAVHVAGLDMGHGLGLGIQKLAIDHLSQHQHVVAARVLADDLALEPSQCLSQQG